MSLPMLPAPETAKFRYPDIGVVQADSRANHAHEAQGFTANRLVGVMKKSPTKCLFASRYVFLWQSSAQETKKTSSPIGADHSFPSVYGSGGSIFEDGSLK
ncbi:hypothetical protein A7U60_g9163 [Sanghuangporus baumii]|uniref:Uncharacterized protein n=1 Tax=Sanghuangporus baumii TaxID=108892 RepID=A0A9Q5HQD3_SANBA|nr:hypothetical protein A7U60_g9163 [Sanghuangporus baumii]